jgi:hypothetical protein
MVLCHSRWSPPLGTATLQSSRKGPVSKLALIQVRCHGATSPGPSQVEVMPAGNDTLLHLLSATIDLHILTAPIYLICRA